MKPNNSVVALQPPPETILRQKIQRVDNLYAALGQTCEAIVRLRDPAQLFEEVCRIAVEFGRFSLAGIVLLDARTGLVEAVAAAGNTPLFMSFRKQIQDEPRGPTLTAIHTGAPYICKDIAADPITAPWRDCLLAAGFGSSASVPLTRGGAPVGALVLYAADASVFEADLLELVKKIASNVSFALDAMEKEQQRGEALRALNEKQRVLTTLMSHLPGMAYRCMNDRYWTMEFVSDGCFELTGYRAHELIHNRSMSYVNLIHPEDRERIWEQVQNAGGKRFLLRYRIITAGRQMRWVWEHGQGVYGADGRLVGLEGIIQDVTAQVAAEKSMIERKEQLQLALDAADQGLWDWNVETGRIFYDAATAKLLGHEARETEGGLDFIRESLHPDDFSNLLASVQKNISGEAPMFQADCRLDRKAGAVVWAGIRGRVMERTSDGRALRMTGLIQDITRRKQVEARLDFLARYDVLTGLPNRTLLRDRLSLALTRADRNGWLVGLLFLNLDRFNRINDTLGHDTGDRVLQEVSSRLRSCLGSVDTIARTGGDEFSLIAEELREPGQVIAVANELRRALSAPINVDGRALFLTASIGIAIYPDDTASTEDMLKSADLALHRAKKQGGNAHVVYAGEMAVRSTERLVLECELRSALPRNELTLHYQPKVDARTNRIIGAEALIRWNHRDGMISPAEFIPIAEETGLIVDIGAWVLEAACKEAATWQVDTRPPVRVAVNLSPRQFAQKNLAAVISTALEKAGLPPECLELEITEGMLMEQGESVIDTLSTLAAMGIRLAIDDFGTGFSSLSYLKRFPVHDVKVDRSFIRNVTDDPDDAAIVTAVVSMAHSLGLELVAEGVETESQLRFLRALGCDVVQGHLFSKAVPAENFRVLLAKGTGVSIAPIELPALPPNRELPTRPKGSDARP